MSYARLALPLILLVLQLACTAQKADPDFTSPNHVPAYTGSGPVVCIDAAHNNAHTADGLYRPFAATMERDGYQVVSQDVHVASTSLSKCAVYVSVNAAGGRTYKLFGLNLPTKSRERRHLSAFSPDEIIALRNWIERGGSILLIADHHPFGLAASALSTALGVEMGGGFTEAANSGASNSLDRSQLLFSRENGLLGTHPILSGRKAAEQIARVQTFTGQSLRSRTGTPLLILGDSATDYLPENGKLVSRTAFGPAQAYTVTLGKGRVVVMGEAAALTAQVDDKGNKFGMQVAGTDNLQFVLNIMHWLSRLL
ncbi:MAG: hypothetical protein H0W69_00180 [Gemmatimonadaceae bacterium]|nr:hypothetical protein [Gemmatimonadaceae bacterium]